ncbi:MAG: hypothetical protein Ct9H300mP25_15860 [Acidobacteriota bacterium]|nr:MAG: hypothetical protein Ct9H300mP25_15860 [Acidobacteriota bacterium]
MDVIVKHATRVAFSWCCSLLDAARRHLRRLREMMFRAPHYQLQRRLRRYCHRSRLAVHAWCCLVPARPGPNQIDQGLPRQGFVDETAYLIDFGPGVVRQAAAAAAAGVTALRPPNLRIGFLTHLHSDQRPGIQMSCSPRGCLVAAPHSPCMAHQG